MNEQAFHREHTAFCDCPECLQGLAEMGLLQPETTPTLYDRLKRCEVIHVLAERTGLRFYIHPERWSGVVCAYTVKYEDGTISPQHNRIMLADATVRDWCEQLVEIEE